MADAFDPGKIREEFKTCLQPTLFSCGNEGCSLAKLLNDFTKDWSGRSIMTFAQQLGCQTELELLFQFPQIVRVENKFGQIWIYPTTDHEAADICDLIDIDKQMRGAEFPRWASTMNITSLEQVKQIVPAAVQQLQKANILRGGRSSSSFAPPGRSVNAIPMAAVKQPLRISAPHPLRTSTPNPVPVAQNGQAQVAFLPPKSANAIPLADHRRPLNFSGFLGGPASGSKASNGQAFSQTMKMSNSFAAPTRGPFPPPKRLAQVLPQHQQRGSGGMAFQPHGFSNNANSEHPNNFHLQQIANLLKSNRQQIPSASPAQPQLFQSTQRPLAASFAPAASSSQQAARNEPSFCNNNTAVKKVSPMKKFIHAASSQPSAMPQQQETADHEHFAVGLDAAQYFQQQQLEEEDIDFEGYEWASNSQNITVQATSLLYPPAIQQLVDLFRTLGRPVVTRDELKSAYQGRYGRALTAVQLKRLLGVDAPNVLLFEQIFRRCPIPGLFLVSTDQHSNQKTYALANDLFLGTPPTIDLSESTLTTTMSLMSPARSSFTASPTFRGRPENTSAASLSPILAAHSPTAEAALPPLDEAAASGGEAACDGQVPAGEAPAKEATTTFSLLVDFGADDWVSVSTPSPFLLDYAADLDVESSGATPPPSSATAGTQQSQQSSDAVQRDIEIDVDLQGLLL